MINDRRVDCIEPGDLFPAIASAGVEIAQTVGRGGEEFVGPALELVERRERGLETG